ncbi:MAG: T9SS type A sorting domain-containing protein [Ignavibacteriae bacterium]|nr:T9SS C-terminal target domain-containing protein [Ignavibacteriota bacterium]NOG99496.1 T9SS type A sorting domain-containing protein [Ignavibacteriota bacterium]
MLGRISFVSIFLFLNLTIFSQGKVYFVIGSDTGIWQGLSTNRHIHHYNQDLYTNPARNAYKVMAPGYRNLMTDSYGTPMKLTWWMMAGNTFRYSDNTNIPNANSIVFYLMKKYHGEQVALFQDELSLHYHTFAWTDYDNDGIFWWNQALYFEDYFEDFKFTLAQLLIDENIFPVSFRSGWHYMDNDWQNYLEYVLPFSLHNDYPHKRTDDEEPLDNLFDWSLAPSSFVPYHPSADNYQLPGNLNGYNVRSVYTKRFNQTTSDLVFQNAANGTDQMICIWSHLPENDFLDQLVRVDSIIQISAANYSTVNFEYCTGVEAYQKWLKTADSTSPELILTADEIGDEVYFNISADENIFQTVPFVAVKNVYEQYTVIPCIETSPNNWRTTEPADKNLLAKIGAAVTDTSGNLSTGFINYLPDDIFIDNKDAGYVELYGNWSTSSNAVWDLESRIVNLNPGDSAKVNWLIDVPQTVNYNIFYQYPELENPADSIIVTLLNDEDTLYTEVYSDSFEAVEWNYLTTAMLDSTNVYKLEILAKETGSASSQFASDVIKISALVRDKEISTVPPSIDFGEVVINDIASINLKIKNSGINPLTVSSISTAFGIVNSNSITPFTIQGMDSKQIEVSIASGELGVKTDTLYIQSDDPINPLLVIPCAAIVKNPFKIVDNEDAGNYSESGTWAISVAQAYGNSSRYSFLNQSPLASASFTTEMDYTGQYNIYAIIPTSENSSDDALYTLFVDGVSRQSIIRNQNSIGGEWAILFRSYLPAGTPVTVKVEDTGNSTVGPVLRADAVKFQLMAGTTDIENMNENMLPAAYNLSQNYPNPFNPSTIINFQIKDEGFVSLKIFDVLGREAAVLINENRKAGYYSQNFNAQNLSSGVYFYRLEINNFIDTKKMILLR